jgi:hypothetical protein
MGLSFTIAAGSPQLSSSPAGLMTTFYYLRFETPRTEGPGPLFYIPQEQGGPLVPPGTGFQFRRLLRLAELRWRYSKPPEIYVDNIQNSSSYLRENTA